ncbi:hypothetical protein RND71_025543 [Anisodus tanguticus]|uniref:Uncharacterized protein n=1 Tax=Anisodus tanguticus TaxID=243964 RepID=A0AAE1V5W7_9SOLA|nr:hypothetical protein RND71_025543 [Anisodus tanguticus]
MDVSDFLLTYAMILMVLAPTLLKSLSKLGEEHGSYDEIWNLLGTAGTIQFYEEIVMLFSREAGKNWKYRLLGSQDEEGEERSRALTFSSASKPHFGPSIIPIPMLKPSSSQPTTKSYPYQPIAFDKKYNLQDNDSEHRNSGNTNEQKEKNSTEKAQTEQGDRDCEGK